MGRRAGRTWRHCLTAVPAETGTSSPEVAAARLLRQGRVHSAWGVGSCVLLLCTLSGVSYRHAVDSANVSGGGRFVTGV